VLIFVTGRDIPFVQKLVAQPGIPRPHYVIGDIGTSVVDGRTFHPIDAVEAHIAALWNDSASQVAALLDDEPALRLQPTPFR
jgi:hydroxymethylpyrimidine pyrophosphatase-like HAD family hydrolase